MIPMIMTITANANIKSSLKSLTCVPLQFGDDPFELFDFLEQVADKVEQLLNGSVSDFVHDNPFV